MTESEKGGQLVVLLHGWRAPGDDLVSLAGELARPRTRFLVPAAPLPEPGRGRAWWQIDRGTRPEKVSKDELPPNFRVNPQVTAARLAVQALLREAHERYAPDSVAIVGFSQGAQLALDVALAADPRVDRVAVLSGALIADSLPALRAATPPLPAVFVSHGRTDQVLPFDGATSVQALLTRRGYAVTFFPFPGGHQIPPDVVTALGRFLSGGAG
jgi:phospholipase/carboxylesterase